ncbi:MAG TPA: helix-turn-helix transcriptional regulator [Candidatus Coprovicinus avistercoris]|uniref:Helix-turn-helix transcriptional regulator n=1 Tax=Candidatus Coprovicinus avistercoris TaxID=2840754 RepID=A0A9D1HWA7_9ACTN|nr:helix-turn-helix transcriptional regulator [Candidatus Coprovicinus avistercoris]
MDDLDKRLMGNRIRKLRERRGMTQKELAEACGIGESALRSYELGARYPKDRVLDKLAKVLRVRPEIFEVYGIDTELQLVHALFNFEDRFKLEPGSQGCPVIGVGGSGMLRKALSDWSKKHQQLIDGEITQEEYQDWKDTYNPTILMNSFGQEVEDPYTGKKLVGEEREGAVHAVKLHEQL